MSEAWKKVGRQTWVKYPFEIGKGKDGKFYLLESPGFLQPLVGLGVFETLAEAQKSAAGVHKKNPVRDPEHKALLKKLSKHFSTDEAALRKMQRENPAKFDRCVKAVQKAGKAKNAYAVCTAALKKNRRTNPGWYIHIQKHGRGPVMLFNGKSFSNRPDAKALPFTSSASAMYKARYLLGRYPKLSQYKIWVSDMFHGAPTVDTRVNPRRANPASAALDVAAQKLEDFTGRPATHVEKAPARSNEKTGLVIGELDLIGYRQKREGIDGGRMTRYAHKFRKGSRPLLAVSTDGKQLHVVGGQYEFTDAGIEDR